MPVADIAVGVTQLAVDVEHDGKQEGQGDEDGERKDRADVDHVAHDAQQHEEVGDGSDDAFRHEMLEPLDVGGHACHQCAHGGLVEIGLLHAQHLAENFEPQVVDNLLANPGGEQPLEIADKMAYGGDRDIEDPQFHQQVDAFGSRAGGVHQALVSHALDEHRKEVDGQRSEHNHGKGDGKPAPVGQGISKEAFGHVHVPSSSFSSSCCRVLSSE